MSIRVGTICIYQTFHGFLGDWQIFHFYANLQPGDYIWSLKSSSGVLDYMRHEVMSIKMNAIVYR